MAYNLHLGFRKKWAQIDAPVTDLGIEHSSVFSLSLTHSFSICLYDVIYLPLDIDLNTKTNAFGSLSYVGSLYVHSFRSFFFFVVQNPYPSSRAANKRKSSLH